MAGQRIGQQLQHGKRGDRLARTAFADQRQRLAAGEVEADMADGIDGLYPVTEAHAQVFYLQDGLATCHGAHRKVLRGSKASRTASPMKISRSEARRVGKEGGSTCRSRGSAYN